MSIPGNKSYLSSRAKSVSSPIAELASLSEKSRNDTRASKNLQKIHNNLRAGCPPAESLPNKETLQRDQEGVCVWVKEAERVASLYPPRKSRSLATPQKETLSNGNGSATQC